MKIDIINPAFIERVPKNNINIKKDIFVFKINSLERTPSADIVSFSGKKTTEKKLRPRVQTALDYSQDILSEAKTKKLTLQDIANITSKYSDGVSIYPMSELRNRISDGQNYGAYFCSKLEDDFAPSNKEIFVDLPKPNADEMEMLLFRMNCEHEFTHMEQLDTNNAFNQLKIMSKGDIDYAKAIMGISDAVFSVFDTRIQAQTVSPIIQRCLDAEAFRKYGNITPVEAQINRQMLPIANGLKNEKEMQKLLRIGFEQIFEDVMVSISQNQPEIFDMIPSNEEYKDLMKKVRSYCALKASDEKEAYTTESEVARKSLKTNKTLNIDVFPIYYDILEKALS